MSLFPKKGGRGQNGKKGGRHQKGKLPNKKKPYPGNWKKVLKKNQLGWLQQIEAESIRKGKIMEGNNKDEPKELSEFEKVVQSCYVEWWWISKVQVDPFTFEHAPERVKKNRKVVESAIGQNPYSFKFAKPFWHDRKMVSMAVSIEPRILDPICDCLPGYWRNNPHVMKIALEREMISCYYLGESLKEQSGFKLLLHYFKEHSLVLGDLRLNRLEQEVSHELMKHDGFLLFLAGTLDQSLLISKLGGHSGLLKREVSEFVGVPTGNLLWALRTAKKHIEAELKRRLKLRKYYKQLNNIMELD